MQHELKTLGCFFEEVWTKRKTFEIRKNDRNFQVGDEVKLREIEPSESGMVYTGRTVIAVISYLTDYEQKPGYVVFALAQPTFHGHI